MSNENADPHSSVEQSNSNEDLSEILDRLEAVEEKNAQLEERVEDVEEKNEDLVEENEKLHSEVEELREENEELRSEVEKNTDTRRSRAKDLAEMNARISSVEEKLDATEAVEQGDAEISEDLTPMEQIARLPEHVATEQFDNENHRNTFRARSVVRDFFDYARKTPKGYVLRNPDLCRVLRAQEDGRIESKTGERVMKRVEDLSKGAWIHVAPSENRHGEHILVLEDVEDVNLGGGTVVS